MVGCPMKFCMQSGKIDWVIQRVTAVVLLVYGLGLLCFWLIHPHYSADHWRLFLQNPYIKVGNTIAWLALFWHAWIGVWTVITDYIPKCLRCFAIGLLTLLLVLYAFIALFLTWG